MRTEPGAVLVATGRKPVTDQRLSPEAATARGPESAVETPAPRESAASGGAGDRQASWTLATMLADCARDVRALAGGPVDALLVGCGDGWIAHRLLDHGIARVLAVDARPECLREAELRRERLALDAKRLELCSLDELRSSSVDRFAIVVIALAAQRSTAEREAALRIARGATGSVCVIETNDRLAAAKAARDAGFERVGLADPPLDAERSFILFDRSLLLARPGDAG